MGLLLSTAWINSTIWARKFKTSLDFNEKVRGVIVLFPSKPRISISCSMWNVPVVSVFLLLGNAAALQRGIWQILVIETSLFSAYFIIGNLILRFFDSRQMYLVVTTSWVRLFHKDFFGQVNELSKVKLGSEITVNNSSKRMFSLVDLTIAKGWIPKYQLTLLSQGLLIKYEHNLGHS